MPDFEMGWHHYDWSRIPMIYRLFNILAARDHGKSYMFSNAYPAWQLYRYKPKTVKERINNRGLLFSFSIIQAVDLMSILKENIEGNEILRERLYNKDNWSKTDIIAKNKARLTVKSFGSSVRGVHPYWIIVDDGLKDNVIYSQSQREKMNNYFHSVIMNAIVPRGSVGVVGTPFHNQDLYGDLRTKPGWFAAEYPAIFPDGRVLWDKRYTLKDLLEKRANQGNLIFSRELLCKPITSDSTIFPIEILNTAFLRMDQYKLVNDRDNFPVKFKKVVTACDFAMSSSVGADYSVFGTWGIDDSDCMWLLNFYRAKGMSYATQMSVIKSINTHFAPDLIVMEENQFQQIFVQESERMGLPVVGHRTGTEKNDLRMGLPGLAILFERGKIKIPTGDQRSKDVADMFISEFSSVAFTNNGLQSVDGHDDICMMTWIGVEGCRKVVGMQFNVTWI
jgi:hypothetical protein